MERGIGCMGGLLSTDLVACLAHTILKEESRLDMR